MSKFNTDTEAIETLLSRIESKISSSFYTEQYRPEPDISNIFDNIMHEKTLPETLPETILAGTQDYNYTPITLNGSIKSDSSDNGSRKIKLRPKSGGSGFKPQRSVKAKIIEINSSYGMSEIFTPDHMTSDRPTVKSISTKKYLPDIPSGSEAFDVDPLKSLQEELYPSIGISEKDITKTPNALSSNSGIKQSGQGDDSKIKFDLVRTSDVSSNSSKEHQ